jgi:hypothetical protein
MNSADAESEMALFWHHRPSTISRLISSGPYERAPSASRNAISRSDDQSKRLLCMSWYPNPHAAPKVAWLHKDVIIVVAEMLLEVEVELFSNPSRLGNAD